MNRAVKILIVIGGVVAIAVAIGFYAGGLSSVDGYQQDGELTLSALENPVSVKRDALGIPYIYADSFNDAMTAQGFVLAQNRLFQMELFRYMAQGRLSELIGEKGLKSDRLVRLLNLNELAERQAKILMPVERNYVERYIAGINGFIETRPHEYPKVMSLMGHQPTPWQVHDVLVLQYFQIWSSSVNWKQELLALSLMGKLGAEQASLLMPLTINPDHESYPYQQQVSAALAPGFQLNFDDGLFNEQAAQVAWGSNAWVSGSRINKNAKPIVTNDPHLDPRHLPGFWFPMAIVTPELRVVGTSPPGVPGFGVARTEHVAYGATNGYADMVDLYIEKIDPDRENFYWEGDVAKPMLVREEIIKVKDKNAAGGFREEIITVRETSRGPIISDHGMSLSSSRAPASSESGESDEGGSNSDSASLVSVEQAISLRWSVSVYTGTEQDGRLVGAETGNLDLLLAKSTEQARAAIAKSSSPLNYVVADQEGNIARIASGFVPKRLRGDGLIPLQASGVDSWGGLIAAAEMPVVMNPDKDWAGTANHDILPADYPYAYSTHFSPGWRYLRLKELFDKPQLSADDHWAAVTDNKNMMAERMMPIILAALDSPSSSAGSNSLADVSALAEVMRSWDFLDTKEQVAPLIFQTLFRHLAYRVYDPALGEPLSRKMLDEVYFWQERFVDRFMADDLAWFVDGATTDTANVVGRDELIRLAAADAKAELSKDFGSDMSNWLWGSAHTLTFFHPVFPGQTAARWLGGGVHPGSGSLETLNRGGYTFNDPEHSKVLPSVRIVMDLSDDDKVIAHLPGGVSERLFSAGMKNQLTYWLNEQPLYWWFSDKAIDEHTVQTQTLLPH